MSAPPAATAAAKSGRDSSSDDDNNNDKRKRDDDAAAANTAANQLSASNQREVLWELFRFLDQDKLPQGWRRPALKPNLWRKATPLKQLPGISVDRTGKNITSIRAPQPGSLSGRINNAVMKRLDVLLPNLQVLDLSSHELCGPCDLNHLPIDLTILSLRRDAVSSLPCLTGNIDWQRLPPHLVELDLMNNDFRADEIDLDDLPQTLRFVCVEGNEHMKVTGLEERSTMLKAETFLFGAAGAKVDVSNFAYRSPIVRFCFRRSESSTVSSATELRCKCFFILVLIPFFIVLLLLGIAPAMAGSDAIAGSLCEAAINGSCVSFFSGCATAEITSLAPAPLLCPPSLTCCISDSNVLLQRALDGDGSNNVLGDNVSYFLSPSLDFVLQHADDSENVTSTLGRLCGRVGAQNNKAGPSGLWFLLVSGVIGVATAILVNLLSNAACTSSAKVYGGGCAAQCKFRCTRCCKNNCCDDCFACCCDEELLTKPLTDEYQQKLNRGGNNNNDSKPATNSRRSLTYGSNNYAAAIDMTKEDERDDAKEGRKSSSRLRSVSHAVYMQRRAEIQAELAAQALEHNFVQRCFVISDLLGHKSTLFLVVSLVDAIYTLANSTQEEGEEAINSNTVSTAWTRYNSWAALLINSAITKSLYEVVVMMLLRQVYSGLDHMDRVLIEQDSSVIQLVQEFVSNAWRTVVVFCYWPYVSMAAILTSRAEGKDIGTDKNAEVPLSAQIFVVLTIILLLPVIITHLIPGLVLFLPLLLAALPVIGFPAFTAMFLLSWFRARCCCCCVEQPRQCYGENWNWQTTGDQVFHGCRLFFGLVIAIVFANVMVSGPVNLMCLVYDAGARGGDLEWLRAVFDLYATASTGCLVLQRYSSVVHGIGTVLRLF